MSRELPVLIVEADPALRAYMTSVIERHGLEVVAAASGGEALELLDGRHAQLAVLDLGHAGADGIAVVEQLEEGVPVIVVTADPVNAYARAGGLKGDYQVVPKTLMPELFASAVAAYAA